MIKTLIVAVPILILATACLSQEVKPEAQSGVTKSQIAQPIPQPKEADAPAKTENDPPNPTNTAGAGSSRLSKSDPGSKAPDQVRK